MGLKTPLYDTHVAAGARIVDFGGWDMPVHYGSQIEEHHAVRRHAGMFDVSHMTVVDLGGERVRDYLARLIANDPGKLGRAGKALYTCMLNEDGGIIDDLIVYYLMPGRFRLVVNAATREKDLAWLKREAQAFDVDVAERADLAMIAVQGPEARATAARLIPLEPAALEALKPFSATWSEDWFAARTGYTGEDGLELILPGEAAPHLWTALAEAGVRPAGLGARDTLRLEAGLNLYGSDMDESTTPLESGLAWTVAFEPATRDFIGRAALERQREAGVAQKLVGLVLEGRGVLRSHQTVRADGVDGEGEVTSGTYSPTLERSIALARVPAGTGERVEVGIRGRWLPARVVSPPFVRNGEAKIAL